MDKERREAFKKKQEADRISTQKIIVSMVVTIIASLTAAFLFALYVAPMIENQKAEKELQEVQESVRSQSVLPGNTETGKWQTERKTEGLNVDQKALSVDGQITDDPPHFLFTNGDKGSARKTVDVYLDFTEPRSSHTFLQNFGMLETLIKSGDIDLRVFSVISSSPYSIYASEAMSEAFAVESTEAWALLQTLLKQSQSVDLDNRESSLQSVLDMVETHQIEEVDEASITNGTFVTWLMSIEDDPELSRGNTLPIILINGEIVPESVDVLSSEQLSKYIVEGSPK